MLPFSCSHFLLTSGRRVGSAEILRSSLQTRKRRRSPEKGCDFQAKTLCKHLVGGIASGPSKSGAHPPILPERDAGTNTGQKPLTAHPRAVCFPSSPTTSDTASLLRTEPSPGWERISTPPPQEPPHGPLLSGASRRAQIPDNTITVEKGVGRAAFWEAGDCQQRANLGQLADLWAALAGTLSLQADLGYSGYQTAFFPARLLTPFLNKVFSEKERCLCSKRTLRRMKRSRAVSALIASLPASAS